MALELSRELAHRQKCRLQIRKAMASDAISIAALLRRAFLQFEDFYTPEAFAATVQPESGIATRLGEGPIWVAEKDEEVLGTVSAICLPDSVMIRGMAVDPQARGSGIGRTLLRLTEGYARERGESRLRLYTTAFLHHAIALYRSSGFGFTGETANPHGTELLCMAKTIATE